MKQTAVECFFWKLYVLKEVEYESIMELFEQAKAMEKEQIIEAYQNGDNNGADRIYYHSDRNDKSAEQYYNETYQQSHTPKQYRVWFPDTMEAVGGYWWYAVTDPCGRLYNPNYPNEERDTFQWYIDNGYKIEEVTNG